MLVIDEGAVRPELAGDFLPAQQIAGPFQEHEQHLERLRIQPDADSLASKLSGSSVSLEDPEAIAPGWAWFRHFSIHPVYPTRDGGSVRNEVDAMPAHECGSLGLSHPQTHVFGLPFPPSQVKYNLPEV